MQFVGVVSKYLNSLAFFFFFVILSCIHSRDTNFDLRVVFVIFTSGSTSLLAASSESYVSSLYHVPVCCQPINDHWHSPEADVCHSNSL